MSAPDTLRELRRSQIVAVARTLVAREGLEALTIGALEEKLAYSRGVITYHFAGKDDIVRAVLESAVAEIDEASRAEVRASLSPEEKLLAVLRENVRGFVDRPEAGRVLLSFWSRISSDARIREMNAGLYARYRRGTRKLIEEGVRAGGFAKVDAERVATLVVGLVLGIVTQWYFDPDAVDVEAAVEQAGEALVALLRTGVIQGGGERFRRHDHERRVRR